MVRSVAFLPDGRRALSSSYDKTVRLWDVETGTELARFAEHTAAVLGLACSPDGHCALSGGADGKLLLWQLPDKDKPAK
jgi:WD40 repeat protein